MEGRTLAMSVLDTESHNLIIRLYELATVEWLKYCPNF